MFINKNKTVIITINKIAFTTTSIFVYHDSWQKLFTILKQSHYNRKPFVIPKYRDPDAACILKILFVATVNAALNERRELYISRFMHFQNDSIMYSISYAILEALLPNSQSTYLRHAGCCLLWGMVNRFTRESLPLL